MIRRLAVATLSLAFAAGALAPAFAQDAGRDGGKGGGGRLVKSFERLDRNNDGAVDRSEIDDQRTRSFQRLDRNKDGVIDQDEVAEFLKKREAKAGKGGKGGARFEKQLQAADKNRDGKVTKDEYLDRTPPWFKRADADRDGKVTRQELDTFLAERKNKRGGKGRDDMKGDDMKRDGKDM